MKKILLLLTILFSFFMITNVYAKNNVFIDNIELLENSDTENNTSNYEIRDDGTLNFDLAFTYKNSYIKYKITLKNSSDKDYEFNLLDKKTDHFDYKYTYDDNIIEANSTKDVELLVTYENVVENEELLDGNFNIDDEGTIQLITEENNPSEEKPSINNPETRNNIIIIVATMSFMILLIVLIAKYSVVGKIFLIIIMFSFIVYPFQIVAIEKTDIAINYNINVLPRKYLVEYRERNIYSSGPDKVYYYSEYVGVDKVSKYGAGASSIGFYNMKDKKFIRNVNEDEILLDMGEGYYLIIRHTCLTGETEIEVYDKKNKKKKKKKLKDITYDDLILVWNFYKGCFEYVEPLWIMKESSSNSYYHLVFSDGSYLDIIGDHKVFNVENNKFVSAGNQDEFRIGEHTINSKGEIIELVSREEVNRNVVSYNVITKKHLNMYANGILTSCVFSNINDICDMKYVVSDKDKLTKDDLSGIDEEYINNMNLKEVSVDFKGDKKNTIKYVKDYIKKLIDNKKDID